MEKKIVVSGMIVIIALLAVITAMVSIQTVRSSKSDYLQQQHALRRAQEKAGELSLCRAYAETKVGWSPLPGCKDAAK
jgi:hypothetical protein